MSKTVNFSHQTKQFVVKNKIVRIKEINVQNKKQQNVRHDISSDSFINSVSMSSVFDQFDQILGRSGTHKKKKKEKLCKIIEVQGENFVNREKSEEKVPEAIRFEVEPQTSEDSPPPTYKSIVRVSKSAKASDQNSTSTKTLPPSFRHWDFRAPDLNTQLGTMTNIYGRDRWMSSDSDRIYSLISERDDRKSMRGSGVKWSSKSLPFLKSCRCDKK